MALTLKIATLADCKKKKYLHFLNANMAYDDASSYHVLLRKFQQFKKYCPDKTFIDIVNIH